MACSRPEVISSCTYTRGAAILQRTALTDLLTDARCVVRSASPATRRPVTYAGLQGLQTLPLGRVPAVAVRGQRAVSPATSATHRGATSLPFVTDHSSFRHYGIKWLAHRCTLVVAPAHDVALSVCLMPTQKLRLVTHHTRESMASRKPGREQTQRARDLQCYSPSVASTRTLSRSCCGRGAGGGGGGGGGGDVRTGRYFAQQASTTRQRPLLNISNMQAHIL